MTYLRSVPLDDRALQPPRYGALQPLRQLPVERASSPVLGTISLAARGVRALLRYARQRSELRRARRDLLELDDRLLRDIGLSRHDVRASSFMTKGEL